MKKAGWETWGEGWRVENGECDRRKVGEAGGERERRISGTTRFTGIHVHLHNHQQI